MISQITKQLEKDILSSESKQKKKPLRASNTLNIPPVLQLNFIPEAIDVAQYKNPFGPTNPNGDYISLYRFRDLTNNISQFIRYYSPSGKKIDTIYENIVRGATVKSTATYTSRVFFDSMQKLKDSCLSSLAGFPDSWYPIYASPSDWYDRITQKEMLFSTEIDFSNSADAFSNQFTILENKIDKNLDWSWGSKDRIEDVKPLEKKSMIKKIKFKFMTVQLNRPWLNLDLFEMKGWYLEGQNIGYVSTGETSGNNGIFPLYPTTFLLATDLEVEANWDTSDIVFASRKIDEHGSINLGPFNINSVANDKTTDDSFMKNDGFFIVAWISQLIDFSPKIEN